MEEEIDIWDQPREKAPKKEKEKGIGPIPTDGVGNFIKYNNTVPIVLGFLFLSTSGALAASPEVRDSVYSSSSSVKSVDNSYLLAVNVQGFPFSVTITDVKEDTDTYYVSYKLHTIDLVDSVWKPVDKPAVLTVTKDALRGENLGTYASEQLAQVRDGERQRFTTAQGIERKKGGTQKVIATEYHGLVGGFLGPREDAIPGYTRADNGTVFGADERPEGDPNRLDSPQTLHGYDANNPANQTASVGQASAGSSSSGGTVSSDDGDHEAPVLQLLGDASVSLPVGTPYQDMGVVVTDNVMPTPVAHVTLDGASVTGLVQLHDATPGTHTIVYDAQDAGGNHAQISRTVTFTIQTEPVAEPIPPTPPEPPAPAPQVTP